MPVRPEFRQFYRGPGWAITRKRILDRANNRCEQCGKPNGVPVWVYTPEGDAGQFWSLTAKGQTWVSCLEGERVNFRLNLEQAAEASAERRLRAIRVVIAVVHLNHTPGDDRDDNLRALCQWCHLNYDLLHHHETRGARKDAARPLLAVAS